MAKLQYSILFLAMSILIMQVYSTEIPANDSSKNLEGEEESRLLLGNAIRGKCYATLNKPSLVAPNLPVTLTRLSNNRLYYFSPAATDYLTFDNAKTFCQDHGMHLVTINSATENFLVFNKATDLDYILPANKGAWIGYRDVTGQGVYQWVQPKVGLPPTFFTANEPTPAQCAGYRNLAATPPASESWKTYPCSTRRSFICEMEPICSLVL